MLFSIIVPVYNVEKYLEECLQSILCQADEKDCEVILVDDGSTDKSGEICDRYQKENPRLIKVFHNENQGLLLTRRYGYKHATGEYIVNCDSDDILEPDMLDNIRNTLQKYNMPDMVLFNYYTLHGVRKENGFADIFTTETNCRVDKEAVLKQFMLNHSIVSVCGKIYRRSCVDVNKDYTNFKRISNGEDTLQSIEFFNNCKTFVYLNKALYDYRMGSGMTKKFDQNYYFGFKIVLEELKRQKDAWQLQEFDELFALKVLQTAGRAITQSRYHSWKSIKEQKQYLKTIQQDEMFKKNIVYLDKVKLNLQKNYIVLLKIASFKMYFLIISMLELKNRVEGEKNK